MNQTEALLEKEPNLTEGICWKIRGCPPPMRAKCPSMVNNSAAALFLFCWEVSGTYCKLPSGTDQSICSVCPVYERHGKTVPLEGVKW